MAWTTPGTVTAGEVYTAARYNTDTVGNLEYLKTETDTLTAGRGPVFIKTVSFSAAASVAVTGVFSSAYRTYDIVFEALSGSEAAGLKGQLRNGATTETSANYAFEQLSLTSTTVAAARTSGATAWNIFGLYSNDNSGVSVIRINHPNVAARTTYISFALYRGGASIEYYQSVGDLSTSTQYDGLTLTANSGTTTGEVSIYGWASS